MANIAHDRDLPVPEERFGEQFAIDPYETYAYLRESGPICWTGLYGGAWVVPTYEGVKDGLKDPLLSADRSGVPVASLVEDLRDELRDFQDLFSRWLLFKDPSRHTELRRLVNRSFTPRTMDSWKPRIREIVVELLDDLAGQSRVDFMAQFAYELPAGVIIEMLGVDRQDEKDFISWSNDVAHFFGATSPDVELAYRAQTSLVSMAEYFRPHLEAASGAPKEERETLVSILARAQAETDVVSEVDVLAQCTLLLFAGHETTRNLLGSGLLHLLRHRDQMEEVRDDPQFVKPMIQETLRYDSPIQFIHRVAADAGDLHGAEIRAGDSVVMLIGAANRDPAQFQRPDEWDIHRDNAAQHVAFGHGPHFCLGAPLSNIEAEIAFEEILERWEGVGLASDVPQPDWNPDQHHFRNLRSLWLEL